MSHISNVKRLYIGYRNAKRAKKTPGSIMSFTQWKKHQIELIHKRELKESEKPNENDTP
jgi:phosphoribosylformimino-5-aminoimidazole carboxamide ribonucleotide (ProFAR) isomerase